MITLLIDPRQIGGDTFIIQAESYHHLFRARRLRQGSRIRLVDGQGTARWSIVRAIDSNQADLELGDSAPTHESEVLAELFVAPPKGQRLAMMVEKTTELGINAIRFLDTERGNRDIRPQLLERLQRVAAAAVEQSHRAVLPEVSGPHTWDEVEALIAGAEVRWVLGPGSDRTPRKLQGIHRALFVGPEGGFCNDELDRLQSLECDQIGLCSSILRVETAAIVGSACLMGL